METASIPTGYPDQSEVALLLEQISVSPTLFTPPKEAVSQRHCAWCGDEPDEYGSHSICMGHATQLIEQAHARRTRKALEEVCHVH